MSRITLQKYDNGEQQFVVGWDAPLQTFFWQEFNKEPEAPYPVSSGYWRLPGSSLRFQSHRDAETARWDSWEEMKRYAGYNHREFPTLDDFLAALPDDIGPFINDTVKQLLLIHQFDPDSGRVVVDLTKENDD